MKLLATGSAMVLAMATAIPSSAQQQSLEPVVEAASAINQSAQKSQVTIDNIADNMQERVQQYQRVMKEIDGLKVYTRQLEAQIGSQEQEKADLNASIDEVSVVERQVSPLMLRMIDALQQFVDLDMPFLPQERQQRIAGLRELLERANVDVSEKFRRVLEAYEIETDYGRTIETYNGSMTIDGQEQDVDFLRIGRLTLIYKTRDGSELGIWNQEKNAWHPLDDSYLSNINTAMRIAKKQLAPDMLMMPVFAAQ
ncbi:DUF3450 domain-containing protein [Idiomarina xiamenensis]|uniref:TonB system biopolymer transport component n=1 Tax=Idiomarina xiamenensis 10-D-4 TaxID=740709 RepID=K2LCJ8_9GAMM|nr:DUF3450 domain-containing protein [Idiomarina xiamenensis]EKE87610.1 TonB system biopolymer transport component [Idiomarina xiamenensis 10-D-4]